MAVTTKEEVYQEVAKKLNHDTGEITTEVTSTSKVTKFYSSQEEFIQVYLNDMSGLMNIASKTELQILMQLWKLSSFNGDDNNGNFIIINQKIISDLANNVGVKEQSVRNSISSLLKNERKPLIKDPVFRSTYYLNPTYFFKGALKDRPKAMQVVLQYIDTKQTNEFEPKEGA